MEVYLKKQGLGLGARCSFLKRDSGFGTRDSGFDAIGSFNEKLSISISNYFLIFIKSHFLLQKKRMGSLLAMLQTIYSSNSLDLRFSSPESRVPGPGFPL